MNARTLSLWSSPILLANREGRVDRGSFDSRWLWQRSVLGRGLATDNEQATNQEPVFHGFLASIKIASRGSRLKTLSRIGSIGSRRSWSRTDSARTRRLRERSRRIIECLFRYELNRALKDDPAFSICTRRVELQLLREANRRQENRDNETNQQ